MNENIELLNYIYQNSQMGTVTISQLLEIIKDEAFKSQLESQYAEYKQIHEAARNILNEHGYDEKGISAFEKMRAYLMINIQTLSDKSVSHIAEMMIIGSNMGIIDAVKNIKKYIGAEKNIVKLMEQLKKFEEDNVNTLKEYL